MEVKARWEPGPGIRVVNAEFCSERWVVKAEASADARCPSCRSVAKLADGSAWLTVAGSDFGGGYTLDGMGESPARGGLTPVSSSFAALPSAAARMAAAERSAGGRWRMPAVISDASLTMAIAHISWWRLSETVVFWWQDGSQT
jgi:hypothetical protein